MIIRSLTILLLLLPGAASFASSETVTLKKVELDRSQQTLQQGADAVFQVCMLCHELKFIKYSNLLQIGFSQQQIDELRGDHKMTDSLKATMQPSALQHHFGMIPPDLSLMAKARKGGPDYVYSLMTSYYAKDDGHVDNHVFPGLRMPDVMNYTVYTEGEERVAVEQQAQQVARFLEWAAGPHAAERRSMGYYVIAYLILLSAMLYLVKRRVWSNLH